MDTEHANPWQILRELADILQTFYSGLDAYLENLERARNDAGENFGVNEAFMQQSRHATDTLGKCIQPIISFLLPEYSETGVIDRSEHGVSTEYYELLLEDASQPLFALQSLLRCKAFCAHMNAPMNTLSRS